MKEFFKWLNNWLIQANQRLEITSKELEKKKIEVMQEQRVQDELNELVERKDKLAVFLTKDKPSDIDVGQWVLLHRQLHIMVKYVEVLEQRLALM